MLVHLWICGHDAGTSGSPAAVRGGFATDVLRLGPKDETDQRELRHNLKGIPVHCVKSEANGSEANLQHTGASLKQLRQVKLFLHDPTRILNIHIDKYANKNQCVYMHTCIIYILYTHPIAVDLNSFICKRQFFVKESFAKTACKRQPCE